MGLRRQTSYGELSARQPASQRGYRQALAERYEHGQKESLEDQAAPTGLQRGLRAGLGSVTISRGPQKGAFRFFRQNPFNEAPLPGSRAGGKAIRPSSLRKANRSIRAPLRSSRIHIPASTGCRHTHVLIIPPRSRDNARGEITQIAQRSKLRGMSHILATQDRLAIEHRGPLALPAL
jgi:hypothetical protein